MFSTQAIILLIVYILVILIGLGTTIYKEGMSLLLGLNVVLSIALTVLLAYDTACLTSGQCGTWSWVRTILYILIPIIAIIVWVISLFRKDTTTTTLNPSVSLPIQMTTEEKRK